MADYLTFDLFKSLTTIPDTFVDDVEKVSPGWVDGQLSAWARWIDTRLRKRYASPFAAHDATPPTPPSIQIWLARIVTVRVMLKRGVDPDDMQFLEIKEDADSARLEVLEAANSDTGWFDIPLRVSEDGTAINRADPLSYSEASPYVATDVQAVRGRSEDEAGRGSSG